MNMMSDTPNSCGENFKAVNNSLMAYFIPLEVLIFTKFGNPNIPQSQRRSNDYCDYHLHVTRLSEINRIFLISNCVNMYGVDFSLFLTGIVK